MLFNIKLIQTKHIQFFIRQKLSTSTSSFSKNKQFDEIRVRFAPSPTGKLHIGSLRTAFYNYLFAKKYNGKFLLRIEDTDQERLKKDSIENIVESLDWAGIRPDYGPNISNADDSTQGAPWLQSKRLDLYQKYADQLLRENKAYMCFCDETRLELLRRNAAKRQENLKYDRKCAHLSKETLEKYLAENRSYVIRFKLDDKEITYEDLTNGMHKSNPGKQEGDFVIIKSDKYPTYHFANVVDDHLMRISHVLRGQEWQISTAKHISIYEAFGWQPPVYAHLPLIFNNDGTKISKRQNDIDVLSYRNKGYMRETLLAYLSTIGGGLKINLLEDFSPLNLKNNDFMNVLVENFDETKINIKPIKLNQTLLDNFNRRFIQLKLKTESKNDLIDRLRELVKHKYSNINEFYLSDEYLNSVLTWSQDRIAKIDDLCTNEETFSYLWLDMNSLKIDNLNLQQTLRFVENLNDHLKKLDQELFREGGESFKSELKIIFKSFKLEKSQDAKKKSSNPWELTRLILIGTLEGPSVVELFSLLGKTNVLHRLEIAKNFCQQKLLNK
jgi:glutamyl-tRNA synthetase